jgi:hypothetical protein
VECGAARTLIHRPPDWRIPLALVVTVAALVLAAFAIALVNLSTEAHQTTVTETVTQTAPAAAGSARPRGRARTPAVGGWPAGLPGWTVVLYASPSQAAARASAAQAVGAGIKAGVLDSSQHPSLPPGQWIVFTGRYPTRDAAEAEAQLLNAKGYPTARVRLVGRPGA